MIKRKRKLNKQKLISVRLYTVIGKVGYPLHYFNIGTTVKRTFSEYDADCVKAPNSHEYVDSTGLEQWVAHCDIM